LCGGSCLWVLVYMQLPSKFSQPGLWFPLEQFTTDLVA
jgi:hypothetical protein